VKPLVSVAIPARNSALTLRRAVDSVLSQDYGNLEVIIAVNGSTDNTLDIAKSIEDDRIRVIESQAGIVPALNACLKVSRGDYIARQDADDEWLPGKLSKQVQFLESTDVDILGTQMIVREGESETVTHYPSLHDDCVRWLFEAKNPIGHPSVVFRSSLLGKVGGYWDAFSFAEDMDMWMRMLPYAKISNLEDELVVYHHSPNSNYDPRVPRLVAHHYSGLYSIQ